MSIVTKKLMSSGFSAASEFGIFLTLETTFQKATHRYACEHIRVFLVVQNFRANRVARRNGATCSRIDRSPACDMIWQGWCAFAFLFPSFLSLRTPYIWVFFRQRQQRPGDELPRSSHVQTRPTIPPIAQPHKLSTDVRSRHVKVLAPSFLCCRFRSCFLTIDVFFYSISFLVFAPRLAVFTVRSTELRGHLRCSSAIFRSDVRRTSGVTRGLNEGGNLAERGQLAIVGDQLANIQKKIGKWWWIRMLKAVLKL